MSAVLGLTLALACVAVGVLLGATLVHLGHFAGQIREAQRPAAPPEPTVEIDEAMGLHELARLVALLECAGPSHTRRFVDDIKHPGILAVYLHAAIAAILATPGMVARIRAIADQLLADAAWNLPAAERPDAG